MNRLYFALACFFAVLFKGRLPGGAGAYLLEADRPGIVPKNDDEGVKVAAEVVVPAVVSEGQGAREARIAFRSEGALSLLALLQREGRLVDFLRESLDGYQDADIGVAVRDVHRGCRKVLEEHLKLEPVMPGQEEAVVVIPVGFDPGEVRLVGDTRGAPPFRGTLVHHGWRAVEVRFPTLSEGVDRRVLAPAEVRVA
jgi:hypothetical protein